MEGEFSRGLCSCAGPSVLHVAPQVVPLCSLHHGEGAGGRSPLSCHRQVPVRVCPCSLKQKLPP